MKYRFDAILIDFYGTICAGDREAVESTCTRIVTTLGIDLTPRQFAVRWGEHFFAMIDRSNHDDFQTLFDCEHASLRDTLATLDIEADTGPLVKDLEAYWADPPIYDDVFALLRATDLPVCCISNADTAPLLAAIEKHNLRFDAVITSEAVCCYKPDPAIFGAALEALGVRAARAVHVGDSLHSDIMGAESLGITTVWIERESRIHDIGSATPNHTITSLRELPPLLHGRR